MIIKTIRAGLFAAVLALGATFAQTPVSTPATTVEAASFEWGTVNTSSALCVRAADNASAKVIATYKKGTRLQCLSLGTPWVKINVNGKTGYAYGAYLSTAYGTASQPYKNIRKGTVNVDFVTIRSAATSSSTALTTVNEGGSIQVLSSDASWVKVKANGLIGYAYGRYISFPNGKTAAGTTIVASNTTGTKTTGADVVAYARRFVGNRYVYGGTSLTNGTDCSGFTMRVYEYFGYKLPRTSTEQRSAGTRVSSLSLAQPGDLICYSGHVAIYMGNNMIVHASNAKDGIKISYNASYKTILSIRRILK